MCGRGTTGLVDRLSLRNGGWQWAGVMSASRPHERQVYAQCKPCKVNLHFFYVEAQTVVKSAHLELQVRAKRNRGRNQPGAFTEAFRSLHQALLNSRCYDLFLREEMLLRGAASRQRNFEPSTRFQPSRVFPGTV